MTNFAVDVVEHSVARASFDVAGMRSRPTFVLVAGDPVADVIGVTDGFQVGVDLVCSCDRVLARNVYSGVAVDCHGDT